MWWYLLVNLKLQVSFGMNLKKRIIEIFKIKNVLKKLDVVPLKKNNY